MQMISKQNNSSFPVKAVFVIYCDDLIVNYNFGAYATLQGDILVLKILKFILLHTTDIWYYVLKQKIIILKQIMHYDFWSVCLVTKHIACIIGLEFINFFIPRFVSCDV